ncbi:putative lipoprotein precursor [Marinobacter nauticus ATCC 49840]|nr:peptidase M23 [Marinobacter sp.]MAL32437.1 peptidase M23 [Marinobacter sp.]TPW22749.1 LysM peptidoglycan-binding domain-containing protein [Marinobacter nauticus]CCG95832.1 putative lipoprotein precursor [Marinobacter nauticus ATCC 49840]
MFRALMTALLVVAVLVLSGCNTSAIYQDDLYNPPVYWGSHVVKKGETLYRIAWQYGRDYRELGNANGIGPPWNIRPGQVLRLDRKGTIPRTARTTAPSRPAASPPPSRSGAGATVSKPAAKPATSAPTARSSGSQVVANVRWHWPHSGTVIANFSSSGKVNKGIDIAGNPGDAVKAAADGSVVYAGNGLLGYGNLIIVNHNEHYLSAYAHNRKILVKEGEGVKAGQVIAELGNTGTDKPKLHFEIRKNGNPVDPSRYLPRR